jgi:nicotinamidase-related amidase
MKTALIILDPINDIIHPKGKLAGGGTAEHAQSSGLIQALNQAVAIGREKGWLIIWVKIGFSAHYAEQPKHSPFFGKAHIAGALQLGEWGTDFHENLDVQSGDCIVVKHRISPFYNTPLESILRANTAERVVLTGVSTTWAVEAAARDAHDRDYRTVVVEDACAARNEEGHLDSIKHLGMIAEIRKVQGLQTL